MGVLKIVIVAIRRKFWRLGDRLKKLIKILKILLKRNSISKAVILLPFRCAKYVFPTSLSNSAFLAKSSSESENQLQVLSRKQLFCWKTNQFRQAVFDVGFKIKFREFFLFNCFDKFIESLGKYNFCSLFARIVGLHARR